jgi:hypothetical protein
MAAVPFAARALVGTLPEAVLESASSNPVTLKDMIEDFIQQCPEASTMIENIMQSGAATFVLHCRETRHAEVLLHSGLTYRSHPVKFVPAPNTQWVKLTRVVYGTTENAIKSRMGDYGKVLKIRRELIHGIGISTYSVKMEISKPIPSRLTITNFPVNVFYRGQVQQCFRCEQTGHISKFCPFKKSAGSQPALITGATTVVPTETMATDAPGGSTPAGAASGVHDSPRSSDPPVPDPPVVPQSDEESSSSTPVNPDTGKRQLSDTHHVMPSKKDKPAEISYEVFEAEYLRAQVMGKGTSEADKQALFEMRDSLPAETVKRYHHTFQFRHPLRMGTTVNPKVLADICSLQWPADCVDLSASPLLRPVLPPDTPPTDLPYLRYELIRTYMEARQRFTTLPEVPDDAKREIDSLPLPTLKAFGTFFATTHPECLAGLDEETRAAIVASYVERTRFKD